jgi:hypothetical protein
MPDGTTVILKCDRRINADASRQLNDERATLYQEIFALRLNEQVQPAFDALRKKANPQIVLRHEQPNAAAYAQANSGVQSKQPLAPDKAGLPGPPPTARIVGVTPAGN